MANSERQFQRWFLKEWRSCNLWGENIHPSYGTKTGIPDLFVLAGGIMVPIELKTGGIGEEGLSVSDIRPAQIRWSRSFARHNGISGLIAGVFIEGHWYCAVIRNEAWWTGKTTFKDEDYVIVDSPYQAVIHVLSQ
jgi:hypothetical protein